MSLQDLGHRRTRDDCPPRMQTLSDQVALGVLGVGQVEDGGVVHGTALSRRGPAIERRYERVVRVGPVPVALVPVGAAQSGGLVSRPASHGLSHLRA